MAAWQAIARKEFKKVERGGGKREGGGGEGEERNTRRQHRKTKWCAEEITDQRLLPRRTNFCFPLPTSAVRTPDSTKALEDDKFAFKEI